MGFKVVRKPVDANEPPQEDILPSGLQLLMGLKQMKRKQEVVLVKNVRDALAIAQNSALGVLCLPYGKWIVRNIVREKKNVSTTCTVCELYLLNY